MRYRLRYKEGVGIKNGNVGGSLEKFGEVNTIWQVGTFLSTMNNTKLLFIGLSNKFLLKKEVAILCLYLSFSLSLFSFLYWFFASLLLCSYCFFAIFVYFDLWSSDGWPIKLTINTLLLLFGNPLFNQTFCTRSKYGAEFVRFGKWKII